MSSPIAPQSHSSFVSWSSSAVCTCAPPLLPLKLKYSIFSNIHSLIITLNFFCTCSRQSARAPESGDWLTAIIRRCLTSTLFSRQLAYFNFLPKLPSLHNPGILDIRQPPSSLTLPLSFCIVALSCLAMSSFVLHVYTISTLVISVIFTNLFCASDAVKEMTVWQVGGWDQLLSVNLPDWRRTPPFSRIQVQFDFQPFPKVFLVLRPQFQRLPAD